MKKFNFRPIFILPILFLLIIISGTFAYFYNEVTIASQFKSMLYDVDIVEEFYDDWGEKSVSFVNNSTDNSPVVLRVNYNEMWTNHNINDNINIYESNNIPSSNDTSGPNNNQESQVVNNSYSPREEPFLYDSFYNNLDLISNTINGENVVIKDWTDDFLNDFVLGSDGWYYYKKVLNSGDELTILNSINLNLELLYNNDDKDKYTNYIITYDSVNDEYNIEEELDSSSNENYPYIYNLTFSFEVIQANSTAVSQIWNKSITINNGNVTWNF